MAISSIIAPITANTAPTATDSETETDRKIRSAFGDMQEIPNLKLRNNVWRFHRITKSDLDSSCLYVCPFVHIEQLGCDWADFHEI
jgi:hypothetical protein